MHPSFQDQEAKEIHWLMDRLRITKMMTERLYRFLRKWVSGCTPYIHNLVQFDEPYCTLRKTN